MTHNFNIHHAKQYGLSEAIFLQNLIFWIRQNAANGRHLHEVDNALYPKYEAELRYWTYNSVAAYAELFPYFSAKQVRNVIDSLLKQGVILKGNYSENKYDRTNWYALADEQKLEMDLPKRANGVVQKGKSIQIENQIENNNNNDDFDFPKPNKQGELVTDEVRPTYQTKGETSTLNEKKEKEKDLVAPPATHSRQPNPQLFEELFDPQTNAGEITKALEQQGLGVLNLDETKVFLHLHSYENTAQLKKTKTGWSSHIAKVIRKLLGYGEDYIQKTFGKPKTAETPKKIIPRI